MKELLEIRDLDGTGVSSLRRLILTLADSKRMMGIRYSDWLLGAPSIEAGIAISSMAQDEWGHARLLYAMLKDVGLEPLKIEHERSAEEYTSVGALDGVFEDWAGIVAAMTVVDEAISVALLGFSRGSYEAARTRVPKMLAEEEFHASLAKAWYRRIAGSSSEARSLLRDSTKELLPPVLAWLGADDEAAKAMVTAGVTESSQSMTEVYRERLRDLTALVEVNIDQAQPDSGWDEDRARGPGCPDEDAVERVRGDRNRALLVE